MSEPTPRIDNAEAVATEPGDEPFEGITSEQTAHAQDESQAEGADVEE